MFFLKLSQNFDELPNVAFPSAHPPIASAARTGSPVPHRPVALDRLKRDLRLELPRKPSPSPVLSENHIRQYW